MSVPVVPPSVEPLPDPSVVWSSDRPELAALLYEARRRIASPWALLAAGICRSLLTIPHTVRYRSALHPEGTPLNLAVALVGRSGAGKSTAIRGAAGAVVFAGEDVPDTAHARSGEAIATMLGRVQTAKGEDPVLVFARLDHAVWLHWDEVGQLAQQGDRTGSTMLETVKSVTSGETLGGQNAKGDGVTIPAGSYRAVLTIGVQPRRAGPLLSEGAVAGGLAARFVWLVAEDAEAAGAPRPSTEHPPVQVPLSQWDGVRFVDALPEMDTAHEADTRAAHRGERDPINSRVLLNRAIIGIALANMAGRSHLTPEDWHLAGGVLAHSLDTLDAVAEALAEPDEAERARGPQIEQRLRERMAEMQAQGVPFYEARRKLSRAQGDRLTELLHAEQFAPW
ncbi:hypothetical protein E4V99_13700 [Microbacterium sp. dk485]|uniref:hypothetical protein n=1 Tax=Microbacterium sp. dk485 TaxID=2560021 RepID=UPI0010738496|nr:hypothetical protein [Microbacterium sp. dk485]TFV81991.1 hypothetical protein E4V99_13700 [Microbacterium sp. dk485]